MDDQLKHEEHALLHGGPDEGRGEPRRHEGLGPDEAHLGMRADQAGGDDDVPSPREIEDRAAFAATFTPSIFPAGRDDLIEDATGHFADQELIGALRELPDREYESVGAVREALAQRS